MCGGMEAGDHPRRRNENKEMNEQASEHEKRRDELRRKWHYVIKACYVTIRENRETKPEIAE